jgi:hypothetical protein
MNYYDYFLTFGGFVILLPILVNWLKSAFKAEGIGAQILSWITGVIISLIAYAVNLGIFEGLTWWQAAIMGLGGSLASNGIFDAGLITWLFSIFKITKN